MLVPVPLQVRHGEVQLASSLLIFKNSAFYDNPKNNIVKVMIKLKFFISKKLIFFGIFYNLIVLLNFFLFIYEKYIILKKYIKYKFIKFSNL